MKRIMLSLLTIAAVAVMATGATSAYFSDSKVVHGSFFQTGTVTLNQAWQAPLAISGLFPGSVEKQLFDVNYTGSINGDLYFGFQQVSGGDVLGDELDFQLERLDQYGNSVSLTRWFHADEPYTGFIKIAAGLVKNETAHYRVYVRMDTDAPNTLQSKKALTDIVLYAAQEGAAINVVPGSFN